ncbi:MAG: nucleotidyltransferase family protein [Longimicrobiales bacterium]
MSPEERGRAVAGLLAGAWRSSPPASQILPQALEEISPVLLRQSSGGLAWHRLRGSNLARLPAAAPLREAYRYHTLRVRLLEHQLRRVISFLRDHGIEAILAKGWALGRLYPEAGLRPYGDLDLLIFPHQVPRARDALTSPGAPTAPVEIHTGFPMLADRCLDRLFERSRLLSLEGVSVRILGPEDQLRLSTLHGLNHGLCRPLWLCDVAVALETMPRDFDWDYATRGDRWLSEGVRCSLGLVRSLLQVDLGEAGVPVSWRERPLPHWLVPAALRAFGATRHYMDLPDPEELVLKPRALLATARLRWSNPLEVTWRRRAPWNGRPRLPYQVLDYLLRGGGFLSRIPRHLTEIPGHGGSVPM